MSIISELQCGHKEIVSAVQLLTKEMDKHITHKSYIADIGKVVPEDIGAAEKYIEIQHERNSDFAYDRAKLFIQNFDRAVEENGPHINRLPGVIQIYTREKTSLVSQVQAVNKAKAEFKMLIKSISPDPEVKFEIFREALPNKSKLKLTRNILLAPDMCQSIGFTWKHLTSQVVKTKKEWLNYLDGASNWAQQYMIDSEARERAIELEKRTLINANDCDKFKTERPIKVTPSYTIRRESDDPDIKTSITSQIAHSPIFVIQDSVNWVKVNKFRDYDPSKRFKKRKESEFVIPRLHLVRAK